MTWLGQSPRDRARGASERFDTIRAAILICAAVALALGGLWIMAGQGEVAVHAPSPDLSLANRPASPVGSPAAWVTPDDYPQDVLHRGGQGTVAVAFVVDAQGAATQCRVTSTSGYRSLDIATCQLIERRARYSPARDGQGRAIASTQTLRFRWEIDPSL